MDVSLRKRDGETAREHIVFILTAKLGDTDPVLLSRYIVWRTLGAPFIPRSCSIDLCKLGANAS